MNCNKFIRVQIVWINTIGLTKSSCISIMLTYGVHFVSVCFSIYEIITLLQLTINNKYCIFSIIKLAWSHEKPIFMVGPLTCSQMTNAPYLPLWLYLDTFNDDLISELFSMSKITLK